MPVVSRKEITSITKAIKEVKPGDVVFFDIDETLLYTGEIRYESACTITELTLPGLIKLLQTVGAECYVLTARRPMNHEGTVRQLESLNFPLANIIHAPDEHVKNELGDTIAISTKGKYLKGTLEMMQANRVFMFDDSGKQHDSIEVECAELTTVEIHCRQYQSRPKQVLESQRQMFFAQQKGGACSSSLGLNTTATIKA